ncbi:MAG TPA: HlyD family efflux transporter periplasmic adaptor subunit [Mucilaginibacter sp.]
MKEKMKGISLILAVIVFGFTACQQKQKPAAVTVAKTSDVKYTCPMHPQIMEDHPGSCPICGMTLVKKSGQASEGAGISLNTVLQPVNSSVITSVKAIVPEQKEVSTQIQADGYLDFDTRTFNNIASRFSGRIEKLYIKYAFQEIHARQRIFDIYSPDMVTAQQDLLFVVRNSPAETGLVNAAKQKLLLLGMTMAQVNQVLKTGKTFYSLPVYSPYEGHVHDMPHNQMAGAAGAQTPNDYTSNLPLAIKEGMYVEKGQNLFNVVDPHRLWAVLKISASDVAGLKLDQSVTITLPDILGKTIYGKVDFIEPTLQGGDKTTSIRVYIHNMDHKLKVNNQVRAVIQTGTINSLWLPKTAVTNLGAKKVVWLKTGVSYSAHLVTAGVTTDKEVQIKNGLSVADSVASNAAYLTDSESFIKTQGNE